MKTRLRLTREDGADAGFAYYALLSGAITVSEFIGWVERVILEANDDLPDYIYEVASLNRETATLIDLREFLPRVFSGEESIAEDKVLTAISVLRNPDIVGRSDEPRPRNPKAALKILKAYPTATARFKDFFPGLIS